MGPLFLCTYSSAVKNNASANSRKQSRKPAIALYYKSQICS